MTIVSAGWSGAARWLLFHRANGIFMSMSEDNPGSPYCHPGERRDPARSKFEPAAFCPPAEVADLDDFQGFLKEARFLSDTGE